MHKKTLWFVVGIALIFAAFAFVGNEEARAPSLVGIPEAKSAETVLLKDGDTYDIAMNYVVKDLGGGPSRMLAYNGSIPGPTIRVMEGDTITIRFTNKSDMKTLLHSHGVRMENPYDGSQLVQKEMEAGETFTYILKFPDAGAYWYHPHVRDDMQQAMGAYGNFIVSPRDAAEFPPVDREEVVALGDLLVEDGMLAPFSKNFVTHALMGRFGNTMFVNGETRPLAISARPGEVVRFYLTNVASVRPFNFSIPDAEMKLIAGDTGRIEKEMVVEGVEIHPSERYIVDVRFPKAGTYAIEHRSPGKTYPLGAVTVSGDAAHDGKGGDEFGTLRNAEGDLADEFDRARTYLGKAPDKRLTLTVKTDMQAIMGLMMGGGGMQGAGHDGMMHQHALQPVEWEDTMGAMNVYSTDKNTTWVIRDDDTGKENMDVQWIFKKGDQVKVRIVNDAKSDHPMQHPFHTHGNRFVVLATNGIPNTNMAWKDTTLIRAGDTVDLLIDMSNPGKWMAHCHILEHLHSGMMIAYEVE